jgi:large subunit ribosomal protein L15e
MSYYKYVKEIYKGLRNKIKDKNNEELRSLILERKKNWRISPPIERVEHPTRIDKARQYGYKAKQGFVVARVRIRRGGMRKSRPRSGRRPKRMGVNKITPSKSLQRIAEERAQRKFPNLEVLASYWLWQDGQYKWYEVLLVDKHHPSIKSDKDINWICEKQHKRRALRGLTPAGKKGRGLLHKGKGAEKLRPSIKAHDRKGK